MKGRKKLCRDEIAKKLDVGRMVFLFVVVLDFVGLFLAMIMRGMVENHPYRYVAVSKHIANHKFLANLELSPGGLPVLVCPPDCFAHAACSAASSLHCPPALLGCLTSRCGCSNDFEDPELGFSDRNHNEAAPLSHPPPYDRSEKAAALQLQDRPQK